MSSTHKQYPRNSLYTSTQPHISTTGSATITSNIDKSTDMHTKPIQQIQQLYLRIERLQSEMSSVMEDLAATFGLQDSSQLNIENEELKETLIKNQQVTQHLKQKLTQLQQQNKQLREVVERQQLEMEKISSANEANANSLSQQIADSMKNRAILQKQNMEKAIQIEELAKIVSKYEKQVECLTQEIELFKSEIEQNTIISNQKISLFQQEVEIQKRQIQELTNNLQHSKLFPHDEKEVVQFVDNQSQSDSNVLITLKNAKIKSLQNNIKYMQEEIRAKQKQLASIKSMNMKLEKQANVTETSKEDQKWQRKQKLHEQQLREMENKICEKSAFHRDQLKQIERAYSEKINSLQSQLAMCKRYENQIKVVEQSNRFIKQANAKELQIYELEEQIRSLKRKEYKLKSFEDQVEEMKRYEQEQQKRYSSAQKSKYKATQELEQIRASYSDLQKQLQTTQRHKQNVIVELQHLTQQYHQLKDEHSLYRQQKIKFEEEEQAKQEQTLKQIETVQQINRQLENMLTNQKALKQSQMNKYKSILNDYKTLNESLTSELAQYRTNQTIDHLINFEKDELPIKDILPEFSDHSQNQPKFSTNKPTLVSSNESKTGKEEQFVMAENTSLRSQIVQLSIRVQEYRGTIDALEERLRHSNEENIRMALKREYEGKMEIQRMEIINEYNVLLRERQVRVPHADPPSEQNIRYHPQYKSLQQQYLNLQKEILEIEHRTYKTNTQYKDQIEKLRIENEFHRKNIDRLHAQNYRITPSQRPYYQLDFTTAGLIQPQLKEPFNPSHYNPQTLDEKTELQNLRRVVDHTIFLLGLSSSSPSPTIKRSIQIIQEMQELVKQLRQDLQIMQTQKKQSNTKNNILNAQVQLLEEENRNLSRQLSMSREKQKYLESKSFKLVSQSQMGPNIQLKTDKVVIQSSPTLKQHKNNEAPPAQWATHNPNYHS